MKKTVTISTDEFIARLVQCNDAGKKQNALAAAMAVLNGVSQGSERFLRLKELAKHYNIHWITAWRYQFPAHERFGHKVFLISECDQYIGSKRFRARVAELRRERKARRSCSNSGARKGKA
ncbi:MAG TPA: hypothetical protein VN673_14600 [Clostridia bacterium]|nr:hypothetical protein [Clostridia bacterium]